MSTRPFTAPRPLGGRTRRFTPSASTIVSCIAVLVMACGGGGSSNGGTQPPNPGTLALSVPSPAVSMGIGGSGTVSVSIIRGGSFTGSVSLAVSGLPAGVTASFSPASLDPSSTASTLTLTAATSAVAGVSSLTISASGSGVSTQSASVALTIVQPVIALSATPTTLSIAAGQSGTATIGITRSTGFSGAVTLVLDNPPTGFSATFNTSPTTGATSIATIAVAGTVAAGQYTVTVKGSATGAQDKTVAIAVTVPVALPVGFTLVADPVEFELPAGKGWSANGIAAIQRAAGFTGPVTITVSSLGIAAFAAASPNVIAANATATNILALTLDGAPPGVYAGTVRATSPGFADQTAQLRVRVSLPSTGNIVWKFCNASRVPRFFAVKDGSGAWKHVVPDGPAAGTVATPTTFSFSLTQATAGVAMVGLGEKTSSSPLIEGHDWRIFYMTAQEITEQAALECVRWPGAPTRTVNGTITGYQSFDAVLPSASYYALANVGSTGPLTTSLQVTNVQPGPFDLFVTRSNFTAGGLAPIVPQSLILKRGLDPAAGVALPALNFVTDGVVPTAATLNFGNTSGETFSVAQSFMTANGLNALFSASAAYSITNRSWYGVPVVQQIAGDLHQFVATTGNVAARRAIISYAKNPASGTVDFGPPLSAPNVSGGANGASPWIVRATGTLANDYVARASMYLRENVADPRTMTIVATRGWLGAGNAYDVAVPDLVAATGFTAFWNFRRGSPVKWTVIGGAGDYGGPNEVFCIQVGICPVKAVDGVTYKSAQATGSVTVP